METDQAHMNPESIRQEIEQYLQKKHYHSAYELWEELNALADKGLRIGNDLVTLGNRIDRDARLYREEIIKNLKEALNRRDIEFSASFQNEVDTLLENLYAASLPGNDAEHKTYSRRWEARKQEQRDRNAYEQAYEEIQEELGQAYSLMKSSSGVGTESILSYYTNARDIAAEHAASNPGNVLLQELLKQTEAERERIASENEVMMSGGQTDEFVRVLKYIDTLKDKETAPVYDTDDNFMGRMDRDAARAEVIKNAKSYVKPKAAKYGDDAQDDLDRFNPRAAEIILKRYEKFIALDRFIPTENILDGGDLKRYEELRRRTNDALIKLEQAEAAITNDFILGEDDVFAGWGIYLNAVDQYKGVFHSEKIKTAGQNLTNDTRNLIRRHLSGADALIGAHSYNKVRQNLTSLQRSLVPVLDKMRNSDKLHETMQAFLSGLAAAMESEKTVIEERIREAEEGLAAKEHISVELNGISDLIQVRKSREAGQRLAALTSKYPKELLEADPDYGAVSSAVRTSTNAAEELERLKTFLTGNDIDRVQGALNAAQAAAGTVAENYRTQFDALATQLQLKIYMLEAEDDLTKKGYSAAIDGYSAILSLQALKDELLVQAQRRLNELHAEAALAGNNDNLLSEAENELNHASPDLKKIWLRLSGIAKFTNHQQRTRWLDLLVKSVERVDIYILFDHTVFGSLLVLARSHDTRIADTQSQRMQKYLKAQIARDTENQNDLDGALGLWREIDKDKLFGGEELIYISDQITRIEQRLLGAKWESVRQKLAGNAGTNELIKALAEAKGLTSEMRERSTGSASKRDVLNYLVMAVDLELVYALHHTEEKTRANTLTALTQSIVPLERALSAFNAAKTQKHRLTTSQHTDDDIAEMAEDLLGLIGAASDVVAVLLPVETYLNKSADISLFNDAIHNWRAYFSSQDNAAVRRGYKPLLDWYDAKVAALRASLKQEFAKLPETNPEYLDCGTRLLLLNPEDDQGKRMLERLGSLGIAMNHYLREIILKLSHPQNGNIGEWLAELQQYEEKNLTRASEILVRFPVNIPEKGQKELAKVVSMQRNLLGAITGQLGQLKKAIVTFSEQIDRFQLTTKNWLTASNELSRLYTKLALDARKYGTETAKVLSESAMEFANGDLDFLYTFDGHPQIERAKYDSEALTLNIEAVVTVYGRVKSSAEADDFATAKSYIENSRKTFANPEITQLLDRSTLQDDFAIKKSIDGAEVRRWSDVVEFVDDQACRMDRIVKWAEDRRKYVQWDSITDEAIKEAYAESPFEKKVQTYLIECFDRKDFGQAVYQQVLALVAAGRFWEAETYLTLAYTGHPDMLGGRLSIQAVVDYFKRFPLADKEDTYTEVLQDALAAAGSKKAQDIILEIYDGVLAKYQKILQDAKTLFTTVKNRSSEWENLKKEASDKLTEIGNMSESGWRIFSRGNQNLQEKLNSYSEHIKKMRLRFPYHPEIDGFENQPIVTEAWDRVRGKGG